jgi:hypothetical protein
MDIKHFEILRNIDVSEKTEEVEGAKGKKYSYLSWAWAWEETKKQFPDAKYGITKDGNGLPYFYDKNTGYMVFTWVEIEGIRHDMWLPVLDNKFKPMKSEDYKYKTNYGEKIVVAASMFDINKTLMRCLTKNLAMFGMGLNLYSGEDLPETTNNDNSKEDEVLLKLKKILFIAAGKDENKAIQLLEKHTAFIGKDGKQVPGLRDFNKLTNGRLKATYGKLQKEYPDIYKAVKESLKKK